MTFQHVRFTMHPSLLLGRWALTPPFHYHLNPPPEAGDHGYIFSVALSVNLVPPKRGENAPVIHKVRCPMLPGLSSPDFVGGDKAACILQK